MKNFNVFNVEGQFIAAETPTQACEYWLGKYWRDDYPDIDIENMTHDNEAGFFDSEDTDHFCESPDRTMKEQALELIKKGETLPFNFAMELES